MHRFLKYPLLLLLPFFIFFINPSISYADLNESAVSREVVYEGVIKNIEKTEQNIPGGKTIPVYSASVEITKGPKKGTIVNAEVTGVANETSLTYKAGNRVLITEIPSYYADGMQYYLTDHVRYPALYALFLIFIIAVVFAAGIWGIRSLFGLVVSFAVIFWFILPFISRGYNPTVIAIIGAVVILFINFYLSHGFSRKTNVALISTAIALLLTGVLATIYVEIAKLTGFSSEEAVFLQVGSEGLVNIKGLLLAGIIIGVLGILDDITISQASVVEALKSANPKMGLKDTYYKAMGVGRDHIASMVNTLILVYAGSSFPLLLLFLDSQKGYLEVLNYEIIAEEVVRTLVGSIGLILAVPITTLFAAKFIQVKN